jgi:NAD-dependent deacetylase
MDRRHIVILTGAGISAESGIPTFRGAGGLWFKYRIEDVATPEAFSRNPELVLDFYNQRRAQLESVQPNQAHKALARLEQGHRVSVVTQNVDDLHERAGSTSVLHLHGQLRRARSSADPDWSVDIGYGAIRMGQTCPLGSQLRPDVVWFGEPVPMMDAARKIVSTADVLMIVGTSLAVYPAAFLAHDAPSRAEVIVVDPEALADKVPGARVYREKAATRVPLLVDELLEKRRKSMA